MKISKELAFAALMVVVGILLIVLKSAAINWTVTILGIALIIVGILDIFVNKKGWIAGAVEILIGVLLIVFAWVITSIVLFIVAAVLVIYGVYGIILAVQRGTTPLAKFLLALIVPAVYIIAGIFLFLNGFAWAFIVAGIVLVVYGVLQAVQAITAGNQK